MYWKYYIRCINNPWKHAMKKSKKYKLYIRSWYSYFYKCHMRDHLISEKTTYICLKPIKLIFLDTQRVNLVQRKYAWNNSQERNLSPFIPLENTNEIVEFFHELEAGLLLSLSLRLFRTGFSGRTLPKPSDRAL